jgi:hypothetical protein
MLMLFWLPLILMGGIWSVAFEAALGKADLGYIPEHRDHEAAHRRRPHPIDPPIEGHG